MAKTTPAAEPEVLDREIATSLSAVESITRGEIDIQIATAKRYPRSLTSFRARALDMATLDQGTAESCIYALPRDGKTIEGPSARFAEIMASAYGHMRVEGRPVDDDGKFITARGTAWDIENNVLIAFETKRRVTNKSNKRFSDDMISVTSNAATSIAIRNAVLKVVPKAYWGPIYEACRKAAVGDASTLANRRAAMLEYFLKLGATNDKVFTLLGVKGVNDIGLDHMATLKGLATAIKEGDTTVDEAFKVEAAPPVLHRVSETRSAPPTSPVGAVPSTTTPVAAEPPVSVVADVVTITDTVWCVDPMLTGGWLLKTTKGDAISIEREVDAVELQKFAGTAHVLHFEGQRGDDDAVWLTSFSIAD